jgi:hypothetical protein
VSDFGKKGHNGEKTESVLIKLRGIFYQVECGILRLRVECFLYACCETNVVKPLLCEQERRQNQGVSWFCISIERLFAELKKIC